MDALQDAALETVRTTLAFFKQAARPEELRERFIPIAGPEGAVLAPLCEMHAGDPTIIAALARWREENAWVYPTQFRITLEGTADWLRRLILDAPDRILFLIQDADGTPIGHVGFAHALQQAGEIKLENAVRGDPGRLPGIMTPAVRTALEWAQRTLGVRRFNGPVFSDNMRIRHFLAGLGFREVGLIPLRRHEEGDRVFYRHVGPDDRLPPDRFHIRVVYTPAEAGVSAA
ncbi:MAG TPA: GNAT family protein [Gemmataceae bacterium]|nr:GNAT family protein [Gemmataceae bacterium]